MRGWRANELHVGHGPCQQSHARLSLFDHSADCLRDERGFQRRAPEFVRSAGAGPGIGAGVYPDSQRLSPGKKLGRPPKKPVIAFAADESKPEAVPGTLRGHWINALVTDETFAR